MSDHYWVRSDNDGGYKCKSCGMLDFVASNGEGLSTTPCLGPMAAAPILRQAIIDGLFKATALYGMLKIWEANCGHSITWLESGAYVAWCKDRNVTPDHPQTILAKIEEYKQQRAEYRYVIDQLTHDGKL